MKFSIIKKLPLITLILFCCSCYTNDDLLFENSDFNEVITTSEVNTTDLTVLSGYSMGFQHGYDTKNNFFLTYSGHFVGIGMFVNGTQINSLADLYGFETGFPLESISSPNIEYRVVRSSELHTITSIPPGGYTLYQQEISRLLNLHNGPGLYDTAYRIGFMDGLVVETRNDYQKSLILDGVTYNIDLGDDCEGCDPF